MFSRSRMNAQHPLDDAIADAITIVEGSRTNTEEGTIAVANLKTLMELRNADKASTKPLVSPDVLVAAMTHLMGIGMIIGFEKANVITSKALPFVPKT